MHLDSRNVTVEFEVQKVAKLPPGSETPDPEKNGIVPGDGTVPVWSAEAPARGAEGAQPTAYKWCLTRRLCASGKL